jgi:hypothetical protein
MLTAEGCKARRQRFLDRLRPAHPIVLADPLHLRYFANFDVDAVSSSADFGGLLVIRPDGHSTLYHDAKLPGGVAQAKADAVEKLPWYTGQEAEVAPRRLVLRPALEKNGGRIHDSLADPLGPEVIRLVSEPAPREGPGRGRAAPHLHEGVGRRARVGARQH